ncbi:hypothetical protein G6F42_010910 [Rhizopus arrhizus]|nr:hypothetical protein G6F42_010910 [Rhizopus arrhizus]
MTTSNVFSVSSLQTDPDLYALRNKKYKKHHVAPIVTAPTIAASATATVQPQPIQSTQSSQLVSTNRLAYVEALVDINAVVIESIWYPTIPKESRVSPVVPLRTFIQEVLKRSRTTYSTLQTALFYLFRARPAIIQHLQQQQQQRSCDKKSSWQHSAYISCGRRMFLASLVVASKFVQDKTYRNSAWAKIAGLPVTEINTAERYFLSIMDHRLYIDQSTFDADLIRFFLTIGSNRELDDSLRVMALSFLMWAAVYKQNKIRSLKLVGFIVEGLMPIGSEEDPEDVDEDSPSRLAFKVLNALATNMPPQQVFPIVMPIVVTYMQNPDPNFRKAAMMSFAVIIEGCAEYMSPKLNDLLPLVCSGLQDPEIIVRRAACMALGCLAEEMPVEISESHQVLLPLVFNLMNDTNPEVTKHACNALDAILESLGDEVLQYLPMLMEKLLFLLDNAPQTETKATVMAAIGSAAHAAGEGFEPYFGGVMPRIRHLMTLTEGTDEALLRGVATDSAGAIAEAVGADKFRPFTQDLMALAIEQLTLDSPRLRECSYAFFSIMARVFGEEFAPYLPTVMPPIIASCKAEEKDEANFGSEIDLTLGEGDEEDDDSAFNFNSAIADEKEFAADALGELFESTQTHFLPYVEPAVQELTELSFHLFDGVRKAVVGSLFSFLKTFYLMSGSEEWKAGLPVNYPVHENVQNMTTIIIPTVLAMWKDEDDKMVVVQICQELIQSLKLMGPSIIADHIEEISRNILDIFEKRSICQQSYDEEDFVDEEEEAESESLLINAAGDLVATICETVGESYSSYFDVFMPLIAKYYKKSKSAPERSMAIGCLGECITGIKSAVTPHTERLLQLFVKACADEDQSVRSNAAYALGILTGNSQIDLGSQYPVILTALHPLFQNQPVPNITDNATGAVARLILARPEAVPLDQVLPVFISVLPLKADFAENEPVFNCLFSLFRANNTFIQSQIPNLLPVFHHVLGNEDQLNESTRNELVELLRALNTQSPSLGMSNSDLARFL